MTSVGIVASFICQFFAFINGGTVETKLKIQLGLSTVLMSGLLIPTLQMLPESLDINFAGKNYATTQW